MGAPGQRIGVDAPLVGDVADGGENRGGIENDGREGGRIGVGGVRDRRLSAFGRAAFACAATAFVLIPADHPGPFF